MINYEQEGKIINAAASNPSAPSSGDPVRVGQIAGVAVTDEDSAGETRIMTEGVAHLSVKGIDQNGNSAVAVGDIIYYVDADTPKLSKKNTGYKFGKALGAVDSAGTATIPVMLVQG